MRQVFHSLISLVLNLVITLLLVSGSIRYWHNGLSGKIMLAVFLMLITKGIYKAVTYFIEEKPQILIGKVDAQGHEQTVFIMRPDGAIGGKNVHS